MKSVTVKGNPPNVSGLGRAVGMCAVKAYPVTHLMRLGSTSSLLVQRRPDV